MGSRNLSRNENETGHAQRKNGRSGFSFLPSFLSALTHDVGIGTWDSCASDRVLALPAGPWPCGGGSQTQTWSQPAREEAPHVHLRARPSVPIEGDPSQEDAEGGHAGFRSSYEKRPSPQISALPADLGPCFQPLSAVALNRATRAFPGARSLRLPPGRHLLQELL